MLDCLPRPGGGTGSVHARSLFKPRNEEYRLYSSKSILRKCSEAYHLKLLSSAAIGSSNRYEKFRIPAAKEYNRNLQVNFLREGTNKYCFQGFRCKASKKS